MKCFRKEYLVTIVVLVAVLSGCSTVSKGDEINVDFYGNVSHNNSHTMVDGELKVEGGIPDKSTYSNITVYYLDGDQNFRNRAEVGSIEDAPNTTRVVSSAPIVAEYVVFNSPSFWDGKMELRYYERTDDGYVGHQVAEEGELPGFD